LHSFNQPRVQISGLAATLPLIHLAFNISVLNLFTIRPLIQLSRLPFVHLCLKHVTLR
jgi:hypothetical protein